MNTHKGKGANTYKQALLIFVLATWALLWQPSAFAANDPDVTGDGRVNTLDVSTVASCIGRDLASVARCRCADTNGDNIIDKLDYGFVASKVGTSGYPLEPNACQAIIKPNTPPNANAGPDQTVTAGNTVALSASGSSDADGDTLTFSWSFTSVPVGSTATLSNPNTVTPGFVIDRPGNYIVQVSVSDGKTSSTDTVAISTINSPPVAHAGSNQGIFIGSTVTLNGAASSDADGDTLSFRWSFVSIPVGSTATLSGATTVNPTFIADRSGSYQVQLIVNDGTADSAPSTVIISTRNTPPVANAGVDQSITPGSTVQLNGVASSDIDGDRLTFTWSLTRPTGSAATLSAATAVNPTFTADVPGAYIAQLIVNDGSVNSVADTVMISVTPVPNLAPTANAGADQSAALGGMVQLNGAASRDPEGAPLIYSWAFTSRPAGSAAGLSAINIVNPVFVVDRVGSYIAQLIVNDGVLGSPPDTMIVTTFNPVPVANAGPDQTVILDRSGATPTATVTLDGRASSDANGDALVYSWSFTSVPLGSTATLANSGASRPTFTPSHAGNYVVQLIVSDGTTNSPPDTVMITVTPAPNRAPTANAGVDRTGSIGTAVSLSGSASSDPDAGTTLTYQWSFVSRPAGSSAALTNPTAVNAAFTPDVAGAYIVQLIVNDGTVNSAADTVTISITPAPNTAPVANPDTYTMNEDGTLTGTSVLANDTDANGDVLTARLATNVSTGVLSFNPNGTFTYTPAANFNGNITFTYRANDGTIDGNTAVVTLRISAVNDAPTAQAGPDGTGSVGTVIALNGSASSDPDNDPLTYQWSLTSRPAGSAAALTNSAAVNPSFTPDGAGTYTIQLIVNDGRVGSAPDTVTIRVAAPPVTGLPPNPAAVAPPIDPTVATDIFATTAFLYTGTNPIQTGVAPGTLELKRVAVLRGKVTRRDGSALSAVKISVLGHPEFGQTLTRADGMFDLAVNGGGQLTVRYEKAGFLAVQRAIVAPWRDYAWLPEIVMIPLDSAVTAINLAASTSIQVARGNPVSDADGARRATILFPPGTTATMVLPNGTTQALTTLNVRATEYTVGASGPKAMPAPLPPSSGYTYAVELNVDEAVAAGATEVRFSQVLPVYVENFLGFPVGGAVPSGYYDRQKGQWIASANGRVIKVLGITGGLADLDTDGDAAADDATKLTALGVTNDERARLAQLYPSGQTLWRVPVAHFTPWDFNWPWGPPPDAIFPPNKPKFNPRVKKPTKRCGSIIGCEDQTLGESIPVSGTPWQMHYQSERTPGRREGLNIPVSEATVPPSLRAMRVEVNIAGRLYRQTFAPAPNITYTVPWDGMDGYLRTLQGAQTAQIKVEYDYEPQYYLARSDFLSSFGRAEAAAVPVSWGSTAGLITFSRQWTVKIGRPWDARALGMGGWSLDIQHAYELDAGVLLFGDGRQRSADQMANTPVITRVGRHNPLGYSGDGGPLELARFSGISGIAVGPDGSLFLADRGNHNIRRVSPNGIVTTVAGTGGTFSSGFAGDGGPATAAKLNRPAGVVLGPDGSFYFLDMSNNRIRRVTPDGTINTVAGNGTSGFSGDGGPATSAQLNDPTQIAVGADGSLFIADVANHRIRRVGSDGIITTVAGNGTDAATNFGVKATLTSVAFPAGIAVGPDGSLYIAEGRFDQIHRVRPDGIITLLAGNGSEGYSGGGEPALTASLANPAKPLLESDGSLVFVDQQFSPLSGFTYRLRRVRPDGIIVTIAGTAEPKGFTEGMPAAAMKFFALVEGVALRSDGSLYIHIGNSIFRTGRTLPGVQASDIILPSEDGRELYVFNSSGRHRMTLDALTGAVRHQFAYGMDGYLSAVTDGAGNTTTVERTGAMATAIVAPGGQRTMLNVNAAGWLLSATDPASQAHTMTYSAEGLLQTFTDPRGQLHTFTYNPVGLLTRDENPAGGSITLARTEQVNGHTVTTTSALGRTESFQIELLPTGVLRQTLTAASGTITITHFNTDGSEQATYADGSTRTVTYGPDPRWGMLAPVASQVIETTPGGRTRTVTTTRTATLADPNNVLSLAKLTDTITDNGAVSTRVYNSNVTTRTLTETTASGRSSTTTLDALGRVTQVQALGLDPVSYSYDTRGLLSTLTEGSGSASRTTTLTYNAAYELTGATDALGRTLSLAYDSAGRLVTAILPGARTVTLAYDAAGNISALIPPGRSAHSFGYSPIDQTTSYTPPGLGSGTTATQYTYDADRELTRITRPDGQLVDVAYDPAGRISSLAIARGSLSYSYNATTDQLTGITAPGGFGLSYSYDSDLLTGITWSGAVAGATAYTYNNDLRVTAESVNGTNSVGFVYDADGLLKTAGSLALTHNAQNGLRTGSTLGSVTDSLTYNTLTELTNYSASYTATAIYNAAYSHDALGRITQKIETISGISTTYGYSYDTAGRLAAVSKNGVPVSSYSYDPNGNRTARTGPTVSASYDAQDRLTSNGSTTYSYTANGELLSKTIGTLTTSYQYDALGNLLKVTLPSGTVIDYLIDGVNRRVGKKVGGVLVQGFLYQGSLRPVAELDGSNAVVSRFVYATHINVPDYMIKGGATYRIITDQLGSPRLVVNVATGAVSQRIDYDEFGQVLTDTNPGFQPFGFAGGLYDRDTQLVRFGARDYDAETGRWMAKDPIGFRGGDTNLYAYVANDPLNRLDPFGLEDEYQAAVNNFNSGKGGLMAAGVAAIGSAAGVPAAVSGAAVYAAGAGGFALGTFISEDMAAHGAAGIGILDLADDLMKGAINGYFAIEDAINWVSELIDELLYAEDDERNAGRASDLGICR